MAAEPAYFLFPGLILFASAGSRGRVNRCAKPFILTNTLSRMIIGRLDRLATFRHSRTVREIECVLPGRELDFEGADQLFTDTSSIDKKRVSEPR